MPPAQKNEGRTDWSFTYKGALSNKWPSVYSGSDVQAMVGESVTFKAAAGDRDGQISDYIWYLGDGAVKEGPTVTHAFKRPGCVCRGGDGP